MKRRKGDCIDGVHGVPAALTAAVAFESVLLCLDTQSSQPQSLQCQCSLKLSQHKDTFLSADAVQFSQYVAGSLMCMTACVRLPQFTACLHGRSAHWVLGACRAPSVRHLCGVGRVKVFHGHAPLHGAQSKAGRVWEAAHAARLELERALPLLLRPPRLQPACAQRTPKMLISSTAWSSSRPCERLGALVSRAMSTYAAARYNCMGGETTTDGLSQVWGEMHMRRS